MNELSIGQKAALKHTFTQSELNLFAAISGDNNPIHVDPEFAARTRFGGTVAHGMHLYSLIYRCLWEKMPGPGTVQLSQELKFPSPTYVGEEITVRLEVLDLPSPGVAVLRTDVIRPTGKMSCEGQTTLHYGDADVDYSIQGYFPDHDPQSDETYRHLSVGQSETLTRQFSQPHLDAYLDLVFSFSDLGLDREKFTHHLPGGLLGGLISNLLGTQLPGRGTMWLKQKFHFLKEAQPDDEITGRVEITRIRPEKALVNLRTTLTDTADDVIVDGEALVMVSDLEG